MSLAFADHRFKGPWMLVSYDAGDTAARDKEGGGEASWQWLSEVRVTFLYSGNDLRHIKCDPVAYGDVQKQLSSRTIKVVYYW
eukprot:CAMPEP_0113937982 /NCGR_PEP_ID=MMETSP1339-20121228/4441_1 /TAXON_ID=94617 /ORGANISM="Fibrocapsa japonica" /LENGTH=82 /DNA_ID=CAMNT_0000940905 /DNA_START=223 /DNA_END=468 /DNA_ORIENTATION=- /assembly_acc=CAM_ASM_000762